MSTDLAPSAASERTGPRPSATLVILRDGPDGVEVLLTTRPRHFRFMGGATVFPGGAVAAADADPRWERASARSARSAAADLGDDEAALAYYVCALREAHEEVAFPVSLEPVDVIAGRAVDDPERFMSRCLELGVVLATDRLAPAGRWVTPVGSSVRFDTRFFVTSAPEGWEPAPNPREVADCSWSTPAAALAALGEGRAIMAPPTIDVLQRLAAMARAEDAVAAARSGSLAGGTPVLSARVSPVVRVVVAPNPGLMTGPGTNTYVVGSGPTLVIDPATDDAAYVDAVAAAAGDVAALLVTHRHPDHVGGVAALAARLEVPVLAYGTAPAGGVAVAALEDRDSMSVPGATLRAVHAPGHARDHVCFVLEEERSLFAGDVVLGEGTPVISPPEGDMRAYLTTLERLAQLGVRRVYPGHFRVLDEADDVWRRYRAHRAERERKILAALGSDGAGLDEIVARAYRDTPVELHPLAERSALAHLEMLAADRRVRRRGRLWSARNG